MSVDINGLRTFVEVYKTGSFSKAGKKLGKVQSAISSTISNLEIDLGVELFDRSRKYPVLTEYGKALLKDSQSILEQFEILENRASFFSKGNEPKLRIAADFNVIDKAFFSTLKQMDEIFPETSVEILNSTLVDAISVVKNKIADIGIYASQETEINDKIVKERIGKLKIVPACNVEHALAKKKNVSRNDLIKHKQIAITGRYMPINYKDYTISDRVWLIENGNLVKKLIIEGMGWGLLPQTYIEQELEEEKLKIINCDYSKKDIRINIYVIWNEGHQFGEVGKWLISMIKKLYK
jgi:DNA-binding transcriptional LysR family regulator